jgi:hypothetical protein
MSTALDEEGTGIHEAAAGGGYARPGVRQTVAGAAHGRGAGAWWFRGHIHLHAMHYLECTYRLPSCPILCLCTQACTT